MATARRVTKTGKADDGTISSLCNPGEDWSPRSKAAAVRDIKNGDYSYWVMVGGQRVDVHVVRGEHLSTSPDGYGRNNLLELPDC
ncbi:DUF3892 domain-containing protein [Phytoactinopolyspora mesophila]|uniref:DUF3892 domain-containing protein n=1 Tax=Phytoactinopolyspora mesophila TaxID=2650750 RepID=A0A7K3MAT0_9ACTN|nr:DUF3892 domain-containing protein [Phytoactinopolyspora mesophila]NDL60409.1 DUF3892 domain-containing protein [Phytoactinopolyspora mesophila]